MTSRTTRNLFLFSVPVSISLLAGVLLFARASGLGRNDRAYRELDLVTNVLALVDGQYIERFDDSKSWDVVYHGLKGMTQRLDPYSTFLTPEESRSFDEETHKNYAGVGFALDPGAPPITVDYLFEGSPAEAAGLRPGDRIVSIEGKPIESMQVPAAIALIKGPPKTYVRVTVVHAGGGAREEMTLERAVIPRPSVLDAHLVDPERKVGYVYLNGFGDTTAEEFDRALEQLKSEGAKSLVIDLRHNPGGLVDSCLKFANRFLKSGVLVGIRGRNSQESRSADPSLCTAPELPLVVLVDSATASAAEIVAGALQDHKRALLVGERTYGKGVIQTTWNLELNDERKSTATVKLTTAEYLTPAGRLIEKSVTRQQRALGGLDPDFTVRLEKEKVDQLEKRIALLQVPERYRARYLDKHQETMPAREDREFAAALAVLRGETPPQDL